MVDAGPGSLVIGGCSGIRCSVVLVHCVFVYLCRGFCIGVIILAGVHHGWAPLSVVPTSSSVGSY